ncbi:hypothetical protein CJU89_0521 [Yarrowia sp. B02]|nr:hypothetical protein CJU89_0521 [Yarrowia sp. B02]
MNLKLLSVLFLASVVTANEAANEFIDLPAQEAMPAVDQEEYDTSVLYAVDAEEVKETPEFFFCHFKKCFKKKKKCCKPKKKCC